MTKREDKIGCGKFPDCPAIRSTDDPACAKCPFLKVEQSLKRKIDELTTTKKSE